MSNILIYLLQVLLECLNSNVYLLFPIERLCHPSFIMESFSKMFNLSLLFLHSSFFLQVLVSNHIFKERDYHTGFYFILTIEIFVICISGAMFYMNSVYYCLSIPGGFNL